MGRTSKRIAALAAEVIRDGEATPDEVQSLAASVLSQVEPDMSRSENLKDLGPEPNRKPSQNKQDDTKKHPNSKPDVPTDADLANPTDGNDVRLPPDVNQEEQESWGDRTARQARENEHALGQGKPLPYPTE